MGISRPAPPSEADGCLDNAIKPQRLEPLQFPTKDRSDSNSKSILELALGSNHVLLANALINVGILKRRLGDFSGSQADLRRALEIYEQNVTATHYGYTDVLYQLALLKWGTRAYGNADSLFRATIAIRDGEGSMHPELARTLEDYARFLGERGRSREAASMATRAKAAWEALDLQDCPD